MTARKDYYGVLGVPKDASQDDIKRAYRKLARKVHPDVNPGDVKAEERFKEISEAYHVLGDGERRKQYDRVGPEAFAQEFDLSDFAQQFSRFFHGGGASGQVGGIGWLDDLLGGQGSAGPFGGRRGAPPPQQGRDVQITLQLPLLEAMKGSERSIRYQSTATGAPEQARVKIPAGVRDGSRIRLRGKGEPGARGGPPGDLYLEISLLPHPDLQLAGDDLHTTVAVTVYEAALGSRVEVSTLDGAATINLPPGTRGGQRLRLSGKGAPGRGGADAGDLIVTVAVQMPERIEPGLAELFGRIRDEHPYDPRKARNGR